MMTSFVLVVLGGVGLTLACVGLNWLVIAIRGLPHLTRIVGTVLTVEQSRETDTESITFYPTIAYTTPAGEQVRFRSKSGVTRPIRKLSGHTASPWNAGQNIDIFHDDRGEIDPCIASLWSYFAGPAGFLVGGILLLMIVVNKWNT